MLDPDVGAGIVLGEAIRAQRHAIGIQRDDQNRGVCEANLELAQLATSQTTATVLTGIDDPRAGGVPGAVDLVLTGLRRADAGGHLASLANTYEMLDTVTDWIWPGGHIVIVCRPERDRHALIDGPGQIIEAARAMGLCLVDHCIALTGALVGTSHVRPRASRREIYAAARARRHREPVALTAHADVLVFGVWSRESAGSHQNHADVMSCSAASRKDLWMSTQQAVVS